MTTVSPARDPRFASLQRSAADAINMARNEPQWQGACKDMYSACQTLSDVAAPQPQDPRAVSQELSDVGRMTTAGSQFAHAQGTWATAAVVLYQTMTDANLVAASASGDPADKLAMLRAMAPSAATYAHRQGQWADAAIVLYQAYRDMQKVSEDNVPGLSPDQQSKLTAAHDIAVKTEQNALQMRDWDQAASAMYAGISSMSAILGS